LLFLYFIRLSAELDYEFINILVKLNEVFLGENVKLMKCVSTPLGTGQMFELSVFSNNNFQVHMLVFYEAHNAG